MYPADLVLLSASVDAAEHGCCLFLHGQSTLFHVAAIDVHVYSVDKIGVSDPFLPVAYLKATSAYGEEFADFFADCWCYVSAGIFAVGDCVGDICDP